MSAETGDHWLVTVWRKLTTIKQGFGVVGHVIGFSIVVVIVIALSLRLITESPWVSAPVLLGILVIAGLAHYVVKESFQFGRDRPEFASLKGEHSVQIIKAQAAKEKAVLLEGQPIAPPQIAPPAGGQTQTEDGGQ